MSTSTCSPPDSMRRTSTVWPCCARRCRRDSTLRWSVADSASTTASGIVSCSTLAETFCGMDPSTRFVHPTRNRTATGRHLESGDGHPPRPVPHGETGCAWLDAAVTAGEFAGTGPLLVVRREQARRLLHHRATFQPLHRAWVKFLCVQRAEQNARTRRGGWAVPRGSAYAGFLVTKSRMLLISRSTWLLSYAA